VGQRQLHFLLNNIWGSGPAPQCIWATAATKWGVTANHPTTSVSSLIPTSRCYQQRSSAPSRSYTSSFDVTVPSSDPGRDLRPGVRGNHFARIDVMLWMNSNGAVQPDRVLRRVRPVADKTNVSVGGQYLERLLRRGSDSDVVSFVRTQANVTPRHGGHPGHPALGRRQQHHPIWGLHHQFDALSGAIRASRLPPRIPKPHFVSKQLLGHVQLVTGLWQFVAG